MSQSKNVCIIAIGMSGTGKTTFVTKFSQTHSNTFCINLDPAVKVINYKPFLDIRDTHEYKKIMKQFSLGPNGAILTALNIYCAQPQKIIEKIQQVIKTSTNQSNIFLIDIPGQIQVFTWSSSSLILTEAVATLMPVKIVYIVDSMRCQNPNIMLSNLLFAQSIQYRLKNYSFTILLNKSDCCNSGQLLQWIKDYQIFMEALQKDSSYLATLSKSIVIHLSQFYEKLKYIEVSAKTGKGIDKVLQQLMK